MIPIITGDTISLVFDRFTPDAYGMFLRTKGLPEHELRYDEALDTYTVEAPIRYAKMLGFDVARTNRAGLTLPAHLFDYQGFFVEKTVEAKRFALWWDTGIGKTYAFLEWARQVQHRTAGKVLIIELLNLIPQVLSMAAAVYGAELQIRVLSTRAELREWCKSGAPGIGITNPEKFIPLDGEDEVLAEITYCAGVVLDESSILKTGGGTIKWALIKSCRGVEYKLSCTATPAPNDPIEYASQAAWLETIRNEGEVLWTFFKRDGDGEWRVKEHALPAFYSFLAGWSCYLRSPGRYGFRDNVTPLPDPERYEHVIEPTPEQIAEMQALPGVDGQQSMIASDRLGIVERGRLAQLSSGFVYEGDPRRARRVAGLKAAKIVEIVAADIADGRQVLISSLYDETTAIVNEALRARGIDVLSLTGNTVKADRPKILDRFINGGAPVLNARGSMISFGFNLQNVGSSITADLDDSFERLYQFERRSYRYGQTRHVRFHYPRVAQLQDVTWLNLQSKRARFGSDVDKMERLFIEAMRDELARRVA